MEKSAPLQKSYYAQIMRGGEKLLSIGLRLFYRHQSFFLHDVNILTYFAPVLNTPPTAPCNINTNPLQYFRTTQGSRLILPVKLATHRPHHQTHLASI